MRRKKERGREKRMREGTDLGKLGKLVKLGELGNVGICG